MYHEMNEWRTFNVLLQHIVNDRINVVIHVLEKERIAVLHRQLKLLQELRIIKRTDLDRTTSTTFTERTKGASTYYYCHHHWQEAQLSLTLRAVTHAQETCSRKLYQKLVPRYNSSVSPRWLSACLSPRPSLAMGQPTSTRVMFHGPTHGSATGALQVLDRGFGTVCRPGSASQTMTRGNFVRS